MILAVAKDESANLERGTDFKRFHLDCRLAKGDLAAVKRALAGTAERDGDGHAWIDEAALVELSGLGDNAAFRDGLAKMMAFAESRGWVRGNPRRVRAHIVWQE